MDLFGDGGHSQPPTSNPASPGAEMVNLELRELLERQHHQLMRRLDQQDQILHQALRKSQGKLPWPLGPLPTLSEASVPSTSPSPTTPSKRRGVQKVESPTASPSPVASDVERSSSKPRKSFKPIFHTFTQADLALKQKAADVESRRTRLLFAAKSSLEGLEQEEPPTCVQRLAQHPAFDTFFALLVLTNTLFIGVEVQLTHLVPGPRPVGFYVVQYIYTFLFTLELIFRMAADGRRLFLAEDWMWGWLDLVVVISSLSEVLLDVLAAQGVVSNMSGLRALRVIRITRFLKTLRLVRVFRFVMALRTLITSILYTLRSLFWALVLLALIIYLFSILLAQAVSDFLLDMDSALIPETTLRYYGSLGQTMLSLFMAVSGGVSWQEVLFPLESMSIVWVLVFLFYVAFTYFAVLNVLTGVFCQSAVESAANDHANVVQSMLANKEAHMEKIQALFSKLGADKDGIITYSMFQEGFGSPAVASYFESLGLDVWDAWSFFKLLDLDSGGAVEVEEFFKGCLRLRGQARGVDVGKIIHDQHWMMKNQGHFQTFMESRMRQICEMLSLLTGVALEAIEEPVEGAWTRGITPFKNEEDTAQKAKT